MNRASTTQRLRMRLICAGAMLALCAACGPGGPRRDTGGTTAGGGTTKATGVTLLAGDAVTAGNLVGKGAAARFNTPRGIVVDSSGNLFVADEGNFVIRKIATDGTVTTFAGTAGTSDYRDLPGTDAWFNRPTALAIDAANNLYVTDNFYIRKVTPAGVVSTVTQIDAGTNVTDANRNALIPAGIAVDAAGNLFVTSGIGTRRISPLLVTTRLEGDLVRNNAPVTSTLAPRGIAANAAGVAYVADLQNAIGTVPAGNTSLTPYAGTDGTSGWVDDAGPNARFRNVVALALDRDGNLFAADAGNNVIRKITTNVNLTTVAGTVGTSKLATGALPGSLADIRGIAVGADGTLYVTSGNAVVKIVP